MKKIVGCSMDMADISLPREFKIGSRFLVDDEPEDQMACTTTLTFDDGTVQIFSYINETPDELAELLQNEDNWV